MLKSFIVASATLVLSTTAFAQSTVIVSEPPPVPSLFRRCRRRSAPMSCSRAHLLSYEGDVLVGRVLPQHVDVHVVDGYDNYAYTVVNEAPRYSGSRHASCDPGSRLTRSGG